MRAIIRIILDDADDAQVIDLKKKVEALTKDFPRTEVEVTMLSR